MTQFKKVLEKRRRAKRKQHHIQTHHPKLKQNFHVKDDYYEVHVKDDKY